MAETTENAPRAAAAPRSGRRWLLAVLPLAVTLVIGGFLLVGLELNPRIIPSALIDKPVPTFDLPPIPGRDGPGLASADLAGEVSLVNVFASWCVACQVEHPLFMEIKRNGLVPLHGLNYKDDPQAALNWLGKHGDPYQRIGQDRNGRVGIEWGVYGVPETFVVNAEGRIVCKQIGPVTERDFREKIMPAVGAARAGRPVQC